LYDDLSVTGMALAACLCAQAINKRWHRRNIPSHTFDATGCHADQRLHGIMQANQQTERRCYKAD
jgi:hypothetical protein